MERVREGDGRGCEMKREEMRFGVSVQGVPVVGVGFVKGCVMDATSVALYTRSSIALSKC